MLSSNIPYSHIKKYFCFFFFKIKKTFYILRFQRVLKFLISLNYPNFDFKNYKRGLNQIQFKDQIQYFLKLNSCPPPALYASMSLKIKYSWDGCSLHSTIIRFIFGTALEMIRFECVAYLRFTNFVLRKRVQITL